MLDPYPLWRDREHHFKRKETFAKDFCGPSQNSDGRKTVEFELRPNFMQNLKKQSHPLRKGRLMFYGHFLKCLTPKYLKKMINLIMSWKCTTPRANAVKRDLAGLCQAIGSGPRYMI